jgi:modulator of FtsH protease
MEPIRTHPADTITHSTSEVSEQQSSKVLRNTYLLLSMTLLFSAITAGVSMALNLPHPGLILTLVGYFGLLFATSKFRNSGLGIAFVFALTGFMGLTLGPILNAYLSFAGGQQIIFNALAATGVIFFSLSAFVLVTKKDFSFLGGFLFAGIIVAFLAGLGAFVFNLAALSIVVSSMFVLLMAGLILYETSNIIQGGETNYIMATTTLFVSIFNLFTSLLHLMGVMGGQE